MSERCHLQELHKSRSHNRLAQRLHAPSLQWHGLAYKLSFYSPSPITGVNSEYDVELAANVLVSSRRERQIGRARKNEAVILHEIEAGDPVWFEQESASSSDACELSSSANDSNNGLALKVLAC